MTSPLIPLLLLSFLGPSAAGDTDAGDTDAGDTDAGAFLEHLVLGVIRDNSDMVFISDLEERAFSGEDAALSSLQEEQETPVITFGLRDFMALTEVSKKTVLLLLLLLVLLLLLLLLVLLLPLPPPLLLLLVLLLLRLLFLC